MLFRQQKDVVITKLNIDLLKNIANSSNGIYINGVNTELVVQAIIERLKEMDKKEFESKQFVAYKDQFQWFIGFAILFLSLELIVFEKKTFWVKKLNLFKAEVISFPKEKNNYKFENLELKKLQGLEVYQRCSVELIFLRLI